MSAYVYMILTANQVIESHSRTESDGQVYPTGHVWLDAPLEGGMRPGETMVVGALDNVGKSRLCLGMVVSRARAGHTSLYVSLEDGDNEVGRRLSKIPGPHQHTFYSFPLPTPESAAQSIQDAPDGTTMVLMDYIQASCDEDHTALKRTYQLWQRTARQRGMALVIASQLTEQRDSNGNIKEPPTRRWLRGCKSMSNMASHVVVMWKPAGSMEIRALLDKNKRGRVGDEVLLQPTCGGVLLEQASVEEPW